MNEHVDAFLPFYLNQTLSADHTVRIAAHLETCAACRTHLSEWQAIAETTREAVNQRPDTPGFNPGSPWTLSPVLKAQLHRRSALPDILHAAGRLVWAQRALVTHTWVLPSVIGLTLTSVLATLIMQQNEMAWMVFPLFAIIPLAATLYTSFLATLEEDPANELISAMPTSLATLLFARLTLALGVISLVGWLGSLAVAALGQHPNSWLALVGIWLGPMLILSAITTALSLYLHPALASGTAMLVWGSTLILLVAEMAGQPLLKIHLAWLMQPSWALFVGQVLLAGLLWLACWLWLSAKPPATSHLEGRRS